LLPRCGHEQDARNLFVLQLNPYLLTKRTNCKDGLRFLHTTISDNTLSLSA
jgi:hypothetical protein